MNICFGVIFAVLVYPLLFENQKLIPLETNKVSYSLNKDNHYTPVPIDITKYPVIYTRDMNIYKIPVVSYFFCFIEIILIIGIIINKKAYRKYSEQGSENKKNARTGG